MLVKASQGGAGAADEDDELKKGWKFGRNEGPMTWPWKLMCAILYMLPWVDVTEKVGPPGHRTGGAGEGRGWTQSQLAAPALGRPCS